jgi:DNA-binding transcriptional ArsR family regulator
VHAETVANAETRQWLERALHMGVGTAKVTTVRDNAGQVELVLTPSRQLEKVSKTWPGPRLYDDGRAPVAIAPSGRDVCIRLFDDNGVRHLMLIGSSNSGKSNAYNVVLLPLVLSGRSVVFYVDGKRGTSSPELARVMDLAALNDLAWRRAIRMVHRILVAREERYGRMGLSGFDVNGEDPVIELVLDEGTTVLKGITSSDERLIEEVSERGRALGVSLKLAVQNAEADQVPGGMNVKTNVMGANGNVIGLRPGTSSGATMTLSATSQEVDLRSLPEGGGWGAILSGGVVAAERARLFWIAGRDALASHLDGFAPRGLHGADLAAADAPDEYEDGEAGLYSSRFTGAAWLEDMQQARSGAPAPAAPKLTVVKDRDQTRSTAAARTGHDVAAMAGEAAAGLLAITAAKVEQGAQSRQDVVDALRHAGPGGATRDELEAATGLSKATVNRHLRTLVEAGQVRREGDLAHLVDADEVGA